MQLARWIDIQGRLPLFVAAGALIVVFGVLGLIAIVGKGPPSLDDDVAAESADVEEVKLVTLGDAGAPGTAPAASAAAPASSPDAALPTPVAAEPLITHVVKSGDTLFGLARQYYSSGREWKTIAEANGLGTGVVQLKIGAQLVIPRLKDAGKTPPAAATSSTAAAARATVELSDPPRTGAVYTVQNGDTFWSISQSQLGNGRNWQKLASANPNIDAKQPLKVGQNLVIPKQE